MGFYHDWTMFSVVVEDVRFGSEDEAGGGEIVPYVGMSVRWTM